MIFGAAIGIASAGIARFGISQAFQRKSFSLFKTVYSKASQHPLGFGMFYAGGTTIAYHAHPGNWRKDYKYVGRPQYVSRL